MRVVPSSLPSEEDNSQKFWIFGPSFVQTPATSSDSSSEQESEEEAPPPPPPPPPPLPSVAGKKRPREAGKRFKRKRTERTRERKKKKEERSSSRPDGGGSTSRGSRPLRGRLSGSTDRWTLERYERAELKVIEVMREKAVELGNQIARKDLRDGARKHIGDTGLLDHLLKHMAGKVVGDRGERFMRGYSSEGVMQYWLEPAELEESRRKGGVGDACQCGTECKAEISQLQERVGILNRDLEELRSVKQLEKNVWKENYERLLKRNIKLEMEMEGMNSSFQGLKENYERLLKRNIKLETEMAGMNSSFEGLKEEMLLLREEKKKEEDEVEEEEEEERKTLEVETVEDPKGSSDNGVGVKMNESKQLQERPPKAFCSPQLRCPYLQLPCRGRVYVNCINGSQKSLGHLSPLSPSLESDQPPSWTNPQCTTQRH